MIHIPDSIGSRYRAATTHDIRSWSFGALKSPRSSGASNWREQVGTLQDQRIFGPIISFHCACGKYRGRQYENMICDRCGVKVADSERARRSRFGHIELATAIPHLFDSSVQLEAVPVLPAAFGQSSAGEGLAEVYEDVLRANDTRDSGVIVSAWHRVAELLLPITIEAHRWSLSDATVLTQGLALVPHGSRRQTGDLVCESCGYPLTGLHARVCPGCGNPIVSSDSQDRG